MLDAAQQAVCDMHGRTALVLAGPGCGKTHILALRVFKANAEHGVGFDDMLCLTFTNRAAREMNERISALMGYKPEGLFVGNMHRFCFRFLMANGLVPPETGIMDEEDVLEYLDTTFGIVRAGDVANFQKAVMRVYQDEHDFPEGLKQRLRFTLSDADYERVKEYMAYKQRHELIDFDEMILRTYEALTSPEGDLLEMSAFSWVQVDEVQDMTPLQLAIVGRLTANADARVTCLYLGDEQQAIFSFLGAGGAALDQLKRQCGKNILRLQRNYRSPRRLVELCNELASVWLDIDRDFLPEAHPYATDESEVHLVVTDTPGLDMASEVGRLQMLHPGESIAVLTHTNALGDEASEMLRACGIDHIHLSRRDVFKQASFKTVYSHVAVAVNPWRRGEWARLLYQSGSVRTLRSARRLCAGLVDRGIAPDELLAPDAPGAIERFCELMDEEKGLTVAVIDTETTGLDIFEDDVVQIGAVKMRGGRIVEGSEFDILIRTERPLPRSLGNGAPNPLIEVYAQGEHVDAEEAYRLFGEYLSDVDAVAGHNLDFDLPILRFNYHRRAAATELPRVLSDEGESIDTLRVSRLCMPQLRRYRLGELCERLHVAAPEAYHLASADAVATAGLALALRPMAVAKLEGIRELKADKRYRRTSGLFEAAYGHHYRRARALLFDSEIRSDNTLEAELTRVYEAFSNAGFIEEMERYAYVRRLVNEVMVDHALQPRFREQAMKGLSELLTFNEGDLFTNGIINENTSVMTIHKAKGLEMDNVIIYCADTGWGAVVERAKVYYVAFSRARRRLIVQTTGRLDPVVEALRNKLK